jgi:hypothetical protein
MQGDSAILDHVVVNVQTRLDAGAAAYGNLGFSLTGRGHHTLGTSNHLALFQQDYLELLGVEAGRPNPGWDIVANAVGIPGLAFKTGDADALYRRLTEDRVPALPPEEFSRPVTLPEGTFDASFKVVGVNPSPLQGVRFFFCQHLTPHLGVANGRVMPMARWASRISWWRCPTRCAPARLSRGSSASRRHARSREDWRTRRAA